MSKLDLIDVLVNNVGTLYESMEYFTKIPSNSNQTVMNVNMLSYTKMLELILPKMIVQKRGIVINISSQAGERPVPLMAIYSASNSILSISFKLFLELKRYQLFKRHQELEKTFPLS